MKTSLFVHIALFCFVTVSHNSADEAAKTAKTVPGHVGINDGSELFKSIIDTNTGFYLSTDLGRQIIYAKWRNGKVFSTNSVSEFLHIPPAINGEVQKIDSMKIVDGHLEISVGNSNYVLIDSKQGVGRNNIEIGPSTSKQTKTNNMWIVNGHPVNAATQNAKPPEEVFKVIIDERGNYVCTDAGRRLIYLRSKVGGNLQPVDILKFFNISPNSTNANDTITAMEVVGSNLVVYVAGQAHVVKLRGTGGGNN